mmetsp:Transcript_25660/g.60306  ORF Transcript_25660/g.60306 Transcript_25660/m.60306 type:complete len:472 (-) Transcript_25660:45-1460(-)
MENPTVTQPRMEEEGPPSQFILQKQNFATTTTTTTTPLHQTLTCPICFELFQDAVNLVCGHTFCSACILQHFEAPQAFCPCCRRATRPHHVFENLTVRQIIADLPLQEEAAAANNKSKNEDTSSSCWIQPNDDDDEDRMMHEKEQELEDCINVLQQTNLYLKRDLLKARQNLARARNDLDQKQMANQVYHTIQQKLVQKLSEMDEKLKSVLGEKQEQRKTAAKRIRQLETCNDKLMVNTRALEDEMERIKFKAKQERDELQAKVDTLKAFRNELQTKLGEATSYAVKHYESLKQCRQELAQVKTQFNEARNDTLRLSNANGALEARCSQLVKSQVQTSQSLKAHKSRLKESTLHNRTLTSQVDKLEQEMQTQQETIDQLRCQLHHENQLLQGARRQSRILQQQQSRTDRQLEAALQSQRAAATAQCRTRVGWLHFVTARARNVKSLLNVLYMVWVVWIVYMVGGAFYDGYR